MSTVRSIQQPSGLAFSRVAIALCKSQGSWDNAARFAEHAWPDSPSVAAVLKASVAGGVPGDAAWAAPLTESGIASDFISAVRAQEVLSRLPGVRRVAAAVGAARRRP